MMKRMIMAVLLLVVCGSVVRAADDLAKDFASPPASARPGTWWRWINGNITKEGITRDLNEMARQGFGSVDIFDVRGDVSPGQVAMMSPEWREMFKFAVQEAARLGIQVRVNSAAGWGTGGPWLGEAHASKTLRWTETQVDGPRQLECVLPQASGAGAYYRDVAVVAFRERAMSPVQPLRVTASSAYGSGDQDAKNWPPEDVADSDPETFWKTVAAPTAEKPAWIQFDYHEPLTAEAVLVAGAKDGGPQACELQASDDGKQFRKIISFELAKGETRRVAFPAVAAKYFRLVIASAHAANVQLAELQILRAGDEPGLRRGIKWWLWKSANRSFWEDADRVGTNGPAVLTDEYADTDGAWDCRAAEVVDLTARLSPDGKLNWKVPPGRWTILRFGAVLLGEGPRWMSDLLHGGYEADCYSVAAAEVAFTNTVGVLARDVGALAGKTLTGAFLDSYEIGASIKGLQGTWTDDFRAEFVRRRGYDPVKFLPAMARRIVDGRETTDRFLHDYRQTLGDLYLEFYARLTELSHRQGMEFRAESGYGSYPLPQIDGLAAFGRADVPMGEYWFNRIEFSQHYGYADPVRTAASAAHIYGHRLIAAESLTIADGRRQAPSEWKTHLDREYCNGVNQFIANCWSLQYDVTARPGVHTYDLMNPNVTWWEQGRAFLQYLARCNHLLQQGLPVADAAYFFGEDTAKFVPNKGYLRPELPAGYEFDGINAEVIIQRLSVKDGRLVLPDGVSYRYLVLPAEAGWQVTPQLLRKIEKLVRAGATVVGPKPGDAPGLSSYPKSDKEVKQLADKLWAAGRSQGRGRVISTKSVADVFALDGVKPDVDVTGMANAGKIKWCHRRAGETEIYFLSNQDGQPQTGRVTFRVAGRQPELWDALTGATRKAVFAIAAGCTTVPLELAANGSLFVIFRQPVAVTHADGKNFETVQPLTELAGPWTVTFDPKWGGPETTVTFAKLEDWSQRTEEGIQHYSGTATYRMTFDAPEAAATGHSVFLDLGVVKNLAQVRLNGTDLGVVWTAPWRVEVTRALKAKGNELEIDLVNLWSNRLIGDQGLPPAKRFTKTNLPVFKKDSPLVPSGLLGPVTLQLAQ